MKKGLLLFVIVVVSKIVYAQIDSTEVYSIYKEYKYKSGIVASKGYLTNNKPVGLWKSYYITGVIKSEGKWFNNTLDSIWIFYNQLGDTLQKINYFQGKKNGFHFRYFNNSAFKNVLEIKELYINGQRNDKAIYYYESGLIKETVPFIDDKRHGVGFKYDRNNTIISIIRYRNNEIIVQENINRYNNEGKKHGIWKNFFKNDIVEVEENFENGGLNGYVKIYSEEGKLLSAVKYKNNEIDLEEKDFNFDIEIKEEYDDNNNLTFQGSFKGDVPIGVHRYFNDKKKIIKSQTYNIKGKIISEGVVLISGIESGDWIYYYELEKKKAVGKYVNGKKTGVWLYYYQNGRIQQKGSYSNEKLTGSWKWYYDTGELLKEEFYIYGLLDGESFEYNKNGEIISKGNYIEGNKEGEWIYIIGDQKQTGKYVLNEKDEEWKSYYIDENVVSFQGRYLQGNPDGKHQFYYPKGSIKEERYFDEGLKVKSWSKYNKLGDLVIVVQYKKGKEYKINGVKVKLYNNDN